MKIFFLICPIKCLKLSWEKEAVLQVLDKYIRLASKIPKPETKQFHVKVKRSYKKT